MRITLTITPAATEDGDLLSLEIPTDTTVGVLKESVQAEARISKTSQHLYHNGQLLSDDSKTMEQLHIGDGDMLALHVRDMAARAPAAGTRQQPRQQVQQAQQQSRSRSTYPDPETLRLSILGDPAARQQMESRSPELMRHINDPAAFAAVIRQLADQEQALAREREEQMRRLEQDPFDVEAQMKIEEMIRQERVQENLQNAIEHNPEVFGRVHMLYINVEVNGHKVKAFVDSGAQATIMSPSCAEACGIMRLVDKRFAGVARGVGTAAILGRVHSAQIKIGDMHLPCSFTVMEGKDVDLLLGLDMLKRHQACIDLSKDKLIIQGVEVSFLGEADIPKDLEEERAGEPKVAGPGGTTIGSRSGVVSGPSSAPGSAAQPGTPTGAGGGLSGAPPTAAGAAAGTLPSQGQRPPQAQAQAQQQQQPAASQAPTFPAESINTLVGMGFSREDAIQALTACDGNTEYAIGLLLP